MINKEGKQEVHIRRGTHGVINKYKHTDGGQTTLNMTNQGTYMVENNMKDKQEGTNIEYVLKK